MYNEWQEMIATKYETVAVNTEMIKDYKQHFQQHFKASVTSKGHKFKISEYKQFRFSTLHKLQVHASQSMNGVVGDRFTLLKPNCQPNLDAKALYQGMVPVKKAKLDDVSHSITTCNRKQSNTLTKYPHVMVQLPMMTLVRTKQTLLKVLIQLKFHKYWFRFYHYL